MVLNGENLPGTSYKVNVDMVQLTFTVTDSSGRYVRGLRADDVRVREDGVVQKIAAFGESAETSVQQNDMARATIPGTKVFVLFDTSNWMYTGFSYASDAIAEFIRQLDQADPVAVYRLSRNLFRAVTLTTNRNYALSAVRSAVGGDDTALYNSLLLTLRDAAKVPGQKVVVVFSNGPDNASIVSPYDVGAVAEDEGIPIYIVSTDDARRDQISAHVFRHLTSRTGGQLFWARTWKKQEEAFASIRDDLRNSYTLAYYPASNANGGFRTVSVDLISGKRKYNVRTRLGYRPHGKPSRKPPAQAFSRQPSTP